VPVSGQKRSPIRATGVAACVIATLLVAGLALGAGAQTELRVQGGRFTLRGEPTFLYGLSYYGGLGASEETLKLDLDAVQRHGFNWIRVWATWTAYSNDVAAVDAEGRPRAAQMDRLRRLVADCDRRGLVVDVTIGRGNWTGDTSMLRAPEAHRRAIEVLIEELKSYRNWYLDLANERNLTEFGFTSFAELRDLRAHVRARDPERLVTASHSGDIGDADLREYLFTVGVDFLCPHRPRAPETPQATEARTTRYRETMLRLGRVVPLHYQEPLRRGWGSWPPRAEDFVADFRGARAGGAAGWCLHNGAEVAAPDGRPRRSFDLREAALFTQLDAEEKRTLELLKATF
jgi:hypothetical protein